MVSRIPSRENNSIASGVYAPRGILRRSVLVLLLAICTNQGLTQVNTLSLETGAENFAGEYLSTQPRDLTVLAETLAPQEIDRAVLNRLMVEINRDPENTKKRLGLNEPELQEMFITLSNARGFINGSEMANVRAMCTAWGSSTAQGEARIEEALQAYRDRERQTRAFIAKYYGVVLFDIESQLNATSKSLLQAYMDDRRRRMANAGATTWGSPVQNISAGTDTINFHCR